MDTSWWLALAAVVLLALVAALVDGWGRGHRPRGHGGRPPGRAEGPKGQRGRAVRPRPTEIWWANVPFKDGPGGKDRPCLVLSVHGRRATVAKITSKYHDERSGVIPLPPGAVGDTQGRPSFLETDELRNLHVGEFRRRVGVMDPALWDQVRHLAG